MIEIDTAYQAIECQWNVIQIWNIIAWLMFNTIKGKNMIQKQTTTTAFLYASEYDPLCT